MVKITIDSSRLRIALQNVMKATRKAESEIVQRAARNIAFRAASFTPKTLAKTISDRLKTGGLLWKLASISCNRKYGKGSWTRKQHKKETTAILRFRRSGAGAIRAGWIPAIRDLGGTYRGAKLDMARSAATGYGTKPTINNLESLIVNSVVTRDSHGRLFQPDQIPVAVKALERAVEFVTEDIEGYAVRKIEAVLAQHSD